MKDCFTDGQLFDKVKFRTIQRSLGKLESVNKENFQKKFFYLQDYYKGKLYLSYIDAIQKWEGDVTIYDIGDDYPDVFEQKIENNFLHFLVPPMSFERYFRAEKDM